MVKAYENMNAKPIRVSHADLQRYGETESEFKKLCPACLKGCVMVYRDQKSMMLMNVDRCTWCGQTLIYSDKYIGGEPVSHVEKDPS